MAALEDEPACDEAFWAALPLLAPTRELIFAAPWTSRVGDSGRCLSPRRLLPERVDVYRLDGGTGDMCDRDND